MSAPPELPPPELPPLALFLHDRTYVRRPQARRGLDADTLERIQAQWDAADFTPERQAIRQARKRKAPSAVFDSARRVKQRRDDPQQQRTHRGTCLCFSLLLPAALVSLASPGTSFLLFMIAVLRSFVRSRRIERSPRSRTRRSRRRRGGDRQGALALAPRRSIDGFTGRDARRRLPNDSSTG